MRLVTFATTNTGVTARTAEIQAYKHIKGHIGLFNFMCIHFGGSSSWSAWVGSTQLAQLLKEKVQHALS